MDSDAGTDKGTGLAVAFGALAAVGAGFMLFGGSQVTMAWGFAAAMLAGSLAVVAVQVYEG